MTGTGYQQAVINRGSILKFDCLYSFEVNSPVLITLPRQSISYPIPRALSKGQTWVHLKRIQWTPLLNSIHHLNLATECSALHSYSSITSKPSNLLCNCSYWKMNRNTRLSQLISQIASLTFHSSDTSLSPNYRHPQWPNGLHDCTYLLIIGVHIGLNISDMNTTWPLYVVPWAKFRTRLLLSALNDSNFLSKARLSVSGAQTHSSRQTIFNTSASTSLRDTHICL